jgi:hypothetical protein
MGRMSVAVLPTQLAVEAAWADYVRLIEEREADPALLADLAHNQSIARAWKRWFDAYLRVEAA